MKPTAGWHKNGARVPSVEHEHAHEEDWHRFQQLTQLTNHWQRPGWTDGRTSYHWLLTLNDESELRALAQQCQANLRDLPMLDQVPLDTLHLTLQRVGFADEVDSTQLQQVIDMARQSCADLAPFVLHIGWLAGSEGAIRFTALPVEPVVNLRHAVRETLTYVACPTTDQTIESAAFWPHVSIAYCNVSTPAKPIVERVAPLRVLASAKVNVCTVDLVELRRNNRVYRWEVIARAKLER
jgi:2'-5' RNA ligase